MSQYRFKEDNVFLVCKTFVESLQKHLVHSEIFMDLIDTSFYSGIIHVLFQGF